MTFRRTVLSAFAACAAAAVIGPAAAQAVPVQAISDQSPPHLVTFDSATPGTLSADATVPNLPAGERIVGIDYRPATGVLYAVTTDAANAGRVYTVNRLTGHLALVPEVPGFTLTNTDEFGVDFNPAADALRVNGTGEQNYRITLAANPVAVVTDLSLNPGTPDVSAAAYTNNFAGPPSTQLLDLDAAGDQLFLQDPPNNGTLVVRGPTGVGFGPKSAFDINGSGSQNLAILDAATTGLYSINTTTGAATSIGNVGSGAIDYPGMAIVPHGTITVDDVSVSEGDSAVVTLRRQRGDTGVVTLMAQTADGTATAGTHYTATGPTTVTFNNGEVVEQFTVPTAENAVEDPVRSFVVNLTAPTGGLELTDNQATVSITDDDTIAEDAAPTATVTSPTDNQVIDPDSGQVTVTANATDDLGVASVQFLLNGNSIGSDTTAPYSATFTPTGADVGRHSLTVVATDTSGQTASDSAPFSVDRFTTTGVSGDISPGTDKKGQRKFTTTGSVTLPTGMTAAQGCGKGTVDVTLSNNAKTVVTTAKVGADCSYTAKSAFSYKNGPKKMDVTAEFSGNEVLTPADTNVGDVTVR